MIKFRTKKYGFIAVFCSMLCASLHAQNADFRVIPLPREVKATNGGNFELTAKTLICYPQGDIETKRNATLLAKYIEQRTGLVLTVTNFTAQRQCIRLTRSLKGTHTEAYTIRANSDIVLIEGASDAGLFYGVQTFRKALPGGKTSKVIIPATEVKDSPRFAYRGAHLDVARHFVSPDSVRRFIDMMALHNLNRFHWHLTDDQGWRVEIKKYPELTKIGSQRAQTVIGHNSGKYDATPYGGYYTQRQIKEIVRYAAERHITVIPEIDMPGHMQAALAAYPSLGCTGGPYKVWEMWGVSDDVLCAGEPKTYDFIEDVLTEITKLFPSEYIHVGGDECPKTRWKACTKCQAFIRANHLETDGKHTAEERLQSFLIGRAADCLHKLGRRMIGWDETLEGGLSPNATVMSWRGEGGGREAARLGHDVIMSPNTYLYFDYYQAADRRNEPEAIGGYLPLEHVYSYEPVPSGLTSAEAQHIVGVQANLWTEYIKSFRQVEYMELPRMAALAEIAWSLPEKKNYTSFTDRLQRLTQIYRSEGYNFCRTVYNVGLSLVPDTLHHTILATLSTIDDADVYYTLDGSKPTISSKKYTHPLPISQSGTLRAAAIRSWGTTPEVSEHFSFSKSTARPLTLLQPSDPKYTYAGKSLLNDGLKDDDVNYASGRWLGFYNRDMEAVIDLGETTDVSEVSFRACVMKGYWIMDARSFDVAVSDDSVNFRSVAHDDYPPVTEGNPDYIAPHSLHFAPVKARFVKVKAGVEHSLPDWHPGKGHPGYLFVDEIEVK